MMGILTVQVENIKPKFLNVSVQRPVVVKMIFII